MNREFIESGGYDKRSLSAHNKDLGNGLARRVLTFYMKRMSSNIDLYFALSEKEREIVKSAAKSGDSPMTRQVLQLYFPRLGPQDMSALMKDLRAISA